jgi:nicotinamidase-related amidase
MIDRNSALLVIIDIQERLMRVIHKKDQLVETVVKLIKGAHALDVPILWLEQYPEGLGATVPDIARMLDHEQLIRKTSFSAGRNKEFLDKLTMLNRRNLILCGIETHVCVYQTAADLIARDYHVEVVTDAVSSRTPHNIQTGLARMKSLGASLTSLEMILFEMLEDAQGDRFKQILKIVK